MLSKGDDYPIHQTPEPIAFAGTDHNFYDRYFFNGYADTQGDRAFFAAAFGVYPHLNIADAAFVVVRDGVEVALHASRCLEMERMNLVVGPIAIDILEPLRQLRVRVDAPAQKIAAEVTFTARAAPIEEPRFMRRIGPRTFMDYTRLTQNGRYHGWIEVDGRRESVDGFVGTRDHSWGVRPVGARDPQAPAPAAILQFFWPWSPANFAAAPAYGFAFAEAQSIGDGDLSLAALDAANARLRRLLIQLHEAVKARGDNRLDRRILALYQEMAARRALKLPVAKPATPTPERVIGASRGHRRRADFAKILI